jgi:crotonobetaine/carnitine-CoA ligase
LTSPPPKPGVPFEPKKVFEACRNGLEPNFVPTYLQVVDEIPKTTSEKPQERFLLERSAADWTGERQDAVPLLACGERRACRCWRSSLPR